MQRQLVIWLMIGLLALAPAGAGAQESPALVVRLTTSAGAPLAQVRVLLHDRSGRLALAQASTDAHGEAAFARIRLDTVRVTVQGVTPGGARLVQRGSDVGGVLVFMDVGGALVDLVAAPDGLVQLNPATSAARETDAPAEAPIPTAVIAPLGVAPPVAPSAPPAAEVGAGAEPAPPGTPARGWGYGVGTLLIVLILAGIGVALRSDRGPA